MKALSRRVAPHVGLALLTVIALCGGSAALAQTRQEDADRARREGASRDEANARAQGLEMERQRQQQERQEEERRRSQSSPSGGGGSMPSLSGGGGADDRRIAEARARYEKQPPLPASRNPLLGKWQLQRTIGGARNSVLGMLADLGTMVCPGFGEGVLDFRDTVLADGAGSSLDQVRYRGMGNRVAVLGTRGVQLMEFDFEGPNRMRSTVSIDCIFTRVGPAGAAATRAGTPDNAALAQQGQQQVQPRRFEEDAGFRCAGGALVLVKFCAPGGANADCSVCQLGASKNRAADSCGPVTRAQRPSGSMSARRAG